MSSVEKEVLRDLTVDADGIDSHGFDGEGGESWIPACAWMFGPAWESGSDFTNAEAEMKGGGGWEEPQGIGGGKGEMRKEGTAASLPRLQK